MRLLFTLIAAFALQGCVARMATSVITAPVKVASKTVDVLTTSQSESDRNRGRAARKQEEDDYKAEKKARKRAKERAKEGY